MPEELSLDISLNPTIDESAMKQMIARLQTELEKGTKAGLKPDEIIDSTGAKKAADEILSLIKSLTQEANSMYNIISKSSTSAMEKLDIGSKLENQMKTISKLMSFYEEKIGTISFDGIVGKRTISSINDTKNVLNDVKKITKEITLDNIIKDANKSTKSLQDFSKALQAPFETAMAKIAKDYFDLEKNLQEQFKNGVFADSAEADTKRLIELRGQLEGMMKVAKDNKWKTTFKLNEDGVKISDTLLKSTGKEGAYNRKTIYDMAEKFNINEKDINAMLSSFNANTPELNRVIAERINTVIREATNQVNGNTAATITPANLKELKAAIQTFSADPESNKKYNDLVNIFEKLAAIDFTKAEQSLLRYARAEEILDPDETLKDFDRDLEVKNLSNVPKTLTDISNRFKTGNVATGTTADNGGNVSNSIDIDDYVPKNEYDEALKAKTDAENAKISAEKNATAYQNRLADANKKLDSATKNEQNMMEKVRKLEAQLQAQFENGSNSGTGSGSGDGTGTGTGSISENDYNAKINEIKALTTELTTAREELQKLKTLANSGNGMSETQISELNAKIEELTTKLTTAENKIKELSDNDLSKLTNQIDDAVGKYLKTTYDKNSIDGLEKEKQALTEILNLYNQLPSGISEEQLGLTFDKDAIEEFLIDINSDIDKYEEKQKVQNKQKEIDLIKQTDLYKNLAQAVKEYNAIANENTDNYNLDQRLDRKQRQSNALEKVKSAKSQYNTKYDDEVISDLITDDKIKKYEDGIKLSIDGINEKIKTVENTSKEVVAKIISQLKVLEAEFNKAKSNDKKLAILNQAEGLLQSLQSNNVSALDSADKATQEDLKDNSFVILKEDIIKSTSAIEEFIAKHKELIEANDKVKQKQSSTKSDTNTNLSADIAKLNAEIDAKEKELIAKDKELLTLKNKLTVEQAKNKINKTDDGGTGTSSGTSKGTGKSTNTGIKTDGTGNSVTVNSIKISDEAVQAFKLLLIKVANPITINDIDFDVNDEIAEIKSKLTTLIGILPVNISPIVDPTNVNSAVASISKQSIKISVSNINISPEQLENLRKTIENIILATPVKINEFNIQNAHLVEDVEKSLALVKIKKFNADDAVNEVRAKLENKLSAIKTPTSNLSNKEYAQIESITTAVDMLKKAVDEKTEAFKNEGRVVDEVTKKESNDIQAIINRVATLKNIVNEIEKFQLTIAYDDTTVGKAYTDTSTTSEQNNKQTKKAEVKHDNKDQAFIDDWKSATEELNAYETKLEELLKTNDIVNNSFNKLKQSLANSYETKSLKDYKSDLTSFNETFKTQIDNITKADTIKIDKVFNTKNLNAQLEKVTSNITKLIAERSKLENSSVDKTSNGFVSAVNVLNTEINRLETLKNSIDDVFADMKKKGFENGVPETYIQSENKDTNINYSSIRDDIKNIDSAYKEATKSAKEFKNSDKSINTTLKLQRNYEKLASDIQMFAQQNSKFLNDEVLAGKYNSLLSSVQASIKDTSIQGTTNLTKLQQSFNSLKNEIIATGQVGYSLKDNITYLFEKIGGKALIGSSVGYMQRAMRELLTNVKDIDSAMTELKKVTNETNAVYNTFLRSAGSEAAKLGSTMSELINSTADFSRLGYQLDEAQSLAKSAVMYSNVGDLDIETATDDLVSSLKAFDIQTSQTQRIVDKFNEVGNNYALSSSNIGEGLRESASALYVAGNSIDESIAMITGITEITQDSQSAGNALKTLSMRLRGAKVELEEAGEDTDGLATSTSKLRDKILALTAVNGGKGFDIMTDDDTFKSTYEIIKGISEIWSQMSDIDQASLLETIAGKTRANQVSALISNFAQAEASLETSINSVGSAVRENEKYINSIEGKISQFKATFQDLSTTMIDSELMKMPIDLGSGILKFLQTAMVETNALDEGISNTINKIKEVSYQSQTDDDEKAAQVTTTIGTGVVDTVNETLLTPTINNLNLIVELIENIPNGIQQIGKALKILPPILATISAVSTIKKKNGKLNCPLFQRILYSMK